MSTVVRFLRTKFLILIAFPLLLSGCGSTGGSGGYGSGVAYLDIVNSTGVSIFYLYLSSCSSNSWGSDQLGSDVILSGTTYRFQMTPGCWDLRAELSDGRETERFGEQMYAGGSKTWTVYTTRK